MQTFPSRLPEVGTSIFAVMSKMALEHGAINLSQGFPDFRIDEKLINLVYKYMLEGHNQYAPMPGLLALREAIANVMRESYDCVADPETEITITAGATEAIFAAIAAFVRAGDEVIVFDPSYDSYEPAIRLNGGVPVHINLVYPEFSVDWDQVERAVSPRTRMIMINTPHNPSGSVLSDSDLKRLETIAEKNGLIVISDEVYERLVYDQAVHRSILAYPGLARRGVAVFSFGKSFHATGWKCGYAVAPPALSKEIRKTHQFIVFSVNTPLQWALAEYMQDPTHLTGLSSFYQKKRDFFVNRLQGSSFEVLPCRGSYFQVLSYSRISSKSDLDMAEELTRTAKVAAIPLSVFYKDRTDNRLLRFCFAKREDTLERACEILRKL
ncbi:MAG TPA: methionine aminotransferase [Chryseosolibacter sp.]|nr:methionine aminotransferase [Chryseosolibacter sp.]